MHTQIMQEISVYVSVGLGQKNIELSSFSKQRLLTYYDTQICKLSDSIQSMKNVDIIYLERQHNATFYSFSDAPSFVSFFPSFFLYNLIRSLCES